MDIISRAAWRARRTDVDRGRQPTVDITRRSEFFVHYLAERPAALRGAALMRWVQAFHIDSRGWDDIGYNYAVDIDGRAYVGRGRDVIGAHCLDHNTSGIGVVVLIAADEHPTAAALATVRQLWHATSEAAGHQLHQLGHRDGFPTSCPGDELYRWVHDGMPVDGHHHPAPAPQPHHHQGADGPPYPGHPLRIGTRGGPVSRWQAKMRDRGWRIAVDGDYGPASADVARAFQAEKGLAVDGIVGPRTWAATWAEPVT